MTERTSEPVVVLRYEREGELIRLALTNLTNHELREVLVGLWARLDEADRLDHIKGLIHYAIGEGAWLSPIAGAVHSDPGEAGVIDVAALMARGERVRP